MDGFRDKPTFAPVVDANGNLKMLSVLGLECHVMPGAIMLALRCAATEEAIDSGGDQTIQLALSLPQVRGLKEVLESAEQVLQSAASGESGRH